MKVIVDLCVVPMGVGVLLAPYIAACEKVLTEAGLRIQLHASDTALAFAGDPKALVPSFRAVELGWLGAIRTAAVGPDLQQGRIPPALLGGEQLYAVLEQVRLSSGGIDGLTLIAQVEPISSGPSTASGWWW